MNVRPLMFTLTLLAAAAPGRARGQRAGDAPSLVTKAPKEASQYDFLVGEWSLTVKPHAAGLAQKIHGAPRLHGTWRAWRALDGWGIEDELRIVDASGNPAALSHFVRVYDAASKRWLVSSIDVYHGRLASSTAEWRGGEMVSTADGTEQDGRRYISRVRITGITATAFRYSQDRSYDGGTRWDEGVLVIEAVRTGAAAAR